MRWTGPAASVPIGPEKELGPDVTPSKEVNKCRKGSSIRCREQMLR